MGISHKRICVYVKAEYLPKIEEIKTICGEKKFSDYICQLMIKNCNEIKKK